MDKINELKQKIPLEEAVKAAIKYCLEHNILKQFLMEHGSTEVINMLCDEISIEEIIDIRAKEALEDGIGQGRLNEKREIAHNLLTKGSTPEFVREITGLDLETIQKLID